MPSLSCLRSGVVKVGGCPFTPYSLSWPDLAKDPFPAVLDYVDTAIDVQDSLGVKLRPSRMFACPCQQDLLDVYRSHLRHCLLQSPSPEKDITPSPSNSPAQQISTGSGDHQDRPLDIDLATLSRVNAMSSAHSFPASQRQESQDEREIHEIESDESESSEASLDSGDNGETIYFSHSWVLYPRDITYLFLYSHLA